MGKHNQPPNQGQQPVKIRAKPLKGHSCQAADIAFETDICILSGDDKHARKKSTDQSSDMLSTAELISTVGRIWDCASSCLSRLQPKAHANHAEAISQRDSESCYSLRSDNFGVLDLCLECLHVDLKLSRCCPSIVQRSLEILRPTHTTTYIPCDEYFIQNLSLSNHRHSSIRHHRHLKEMSLASVGIVSSLADSYGWISQICQRPDPSPPSSWDSMKIVGSSFSETPLSAVSACCPASGNEIGLSSTSGTGSLGLCTDTPDALSSRAIAEVKESVSSLDSEHGLQTVEDTLSAGRMSTASTVGLPGDYQVSVTASGCNSESEDEIEDRGIWSNKIGKSEMLASEAKLLSKSYSSAANNGHPFLAKQEHAVSGALAGIFVSLCLHPIDTIKTVIQSCQAGSQKSIGFIGQSIISERGLTGLYRGISSNITTSAPISAIYAFTYESVKGYLLPSLSKEYHSVAHCSAGACASIATSFIFTPSERIKQQMQVNSHYRNCWNAVFRIIEKGGLLSLYTGWGAVLCRNIPHSIIKFYTYESLKQMHISSRQPSKQPTTSQTLLCGGLAGSAAALVSTPFDVVKTRLQTQMPGSVRRYHSILSALDEIRGNEGVKGLYRGLIPRFVMYMSQGALFFASYEFFKSVFFVQLPQHKTETLAGKQDDDDPLVAL